MCVQDIQRCFAQATARHVDNALELEVVGRIQRGFEIGRRVPDFLALVKAGTADDAIIEAECDETVFKGAHLE